MINIQSFSNYVTIRRIKNYILLFNEAFFVLILWLEAVICPKKLSIQIGFKNMNNNSQILYNLLLQESSYNWNRWVNSKMPRLTDRAICYGLSCLKYRKLLFYKKNQRILEISIQIWDMVDFLRNITCICILFLVRLYWVRVKECPAG